MSEVWLVGVHAVDGLLCRTKIRHCQVVPSVGTWVVLLLMVFSSGLLTPVSGRASPVFSRSWNVLDFYSKVCDPLFSHKMKDS